MNDRKTQMEKAHALGIEYEKTYGGCAQCVFAALQDTLDMRSDETDVIFKAASGLSGGVGGEGDGHCGAYTGAVLLMGHIIGRVRDEFTDPKGLRKQTNALSQALHARFIEKYGSVTCQNIHRKIFGRPFYLLDPEDRAKFDHAGTQGDNCPAVVGDAAGWTVQILYENGYLKD